MDEFVNVTFGCETISLDEKTIEWMKGKSLIEAETNAFTTIFSISIEGKTKTQQAIILYCIRRLNEGHEVVINNYDSIDFIELMTCPYYRIPLNQFDFYKRLFYDGKIEGPTYQFMQLLNGSMDDEDFWDDMFEKLGKTSWLLPLVSFFNEHFSEKDGTYGVRLHMTDVLHRGINYLIEGEETWKVFVEFIVSDKCFMDIPADIVFDILKISGDYRVNELLSIITHDETMFTDNLSYNMGLREFSCFVHERVGDKCLVAFTPDQLLDIIQNGLMPKEAIATSVLNNVLANPMINAITHDFPYLKTCSVAKFITSDKLCYTGYFHDCGLNVDDIIFTNGIFEPTNMMAYNKLNGDFFYKDYETYSSLFNETADDIMCEHLLITASSGACIAYNEETSDKAAVYDCVMKIDEFLNSSEV